MLFSRVVDKSNHDKKNAETISDPDIMNLDLDDNMNDGEDENMANPNAIRSQLTFEQLVTHTTPSTRNPMSANDEEMESQV